MADDQDGKIHLERTEDKYIVSKKHVSEFKKSINHFMDPGYPNADTKFVINKSIYFDSPDLNCLNAHLEQSPSRYKIRIRTYAPDGIWGTDRFIEIKYKNGSETKKDRIKIGYDGYRSLIENSVLPVDDELLLLNNETMSEDETRKHTDILNDMLSRNKSRPVIELQYKRLAYKQGEDVRLTLDEDIEIKPLPNLNMKALIKPDVQKGLKEFEKKYLNFEDFILEMKYTDKTPKWFRRKVDKLLLESERFSKYVWAMSRLEGSELKASVK